MFHDRTTEAYIMPKELAQQLVDTIETDTFTNPPEVDHFMIHTILKIKGVIHSYNPLICFQNSNDSDIQKHVSKYNGKN